LNIETSHLDTKSSNRQVKHQVSVISIRNMAIEYHISNLG